MSDHKNPGTIDPANQAFPAPGSPRPAPSSSATRCSTGDVELPPTRIAVAASTCSGLPTNSDGEVQRRELRSPEVAIPTGRGLPAEVHAGSASHVRRGGAAASTSSQSTSRPTPPPVEVHAGSGRPGAGLATNVIIR